MEWKIIEPRTYLKLIGITILVVGLGSAAVIYRMAGNELNDVLGYEIVDGKAYPIMPEDSKAYLRGLQAIGGKEGMLLDGLRRSFTGLWHGKTLAYTVTFLTVVISFVVLFIANHLPPKAVGTKDD